MAVNKLERLLNLTALLLDTDRPLTANEIREKLDAYPEELASFRRAFERDKDELRQMGIPLVVETAPGTDPPVDGYRIPRDQYALRDPGLDADELAALHLAASAVQVEGMSATAGLLKLGGLVDPGGRDLGVRVAPLPADPNLPRLFDAVASRTPVRFTYREAERTVDPHRLDFQRGRWYLTGYDHLRAEERNYRLDRIDGDVVLEEGTFDPPTTSSPAGARGAWELGAEEPVSARLRIEGPAARWAVQHVGPDRVVAEEEGAVIVELPVTNRAAFRSFVLSFLDKAEVLEPEVLRTDLIEWLEGIA